MDETTTTSNGNGVVFSADRGDVPSSLIGIGYGADVLEREEEDEELSDAEQALPGNGETSLPGEESVAAAAPAQPTPAQPMPERVAPPTGLSGWLKREPIVAALIVANAPILATLITSITADDQTLSILAGVAALVLNAAVGAARNAVTPVADPKTATLTPLKPANPE
jgi:hypothetical protein